MIEVGFSSFVGVTDSIRLLNISVPHQVGSGHDIQLHCVFILEGHRLYSVKWFKGYSTKHYTPPGLVQRIYLNSLSLNSKPTVYVFK